MVHPETNEGKAYNLNQKVDLSSIPSFAMILIFRGNNEKRIHLRIISFKTAIHFNQTG